MTLDRLEPGQTYYFDTATDGLVDDNGAKHYRLTTGPSTIPGSPDTVYGRVLTADGTVPAAGSVVYVSLTDRDHRGSAGNSLPLSAVVRPNGYWSVNLANARVADLASAFAYSASGDDLSVRIKADPNGEWTSVADTGADSPMADIVIATWPATSSVYLPIGTMGLARPQLGAGARHLDRNRLLVPASW